MDLQLPEFQSLTLNIAMIVGSVLVMLGVLLLLRWYDTYRLPDGKAKELRQERLEAWDEVYMAISLCKPTKLWQAVWGKLLPALRHYRLHMPNYSTGVVIAGLTKVLAAYALAYDGWHLARDIWSDLWSFLEDWLRERYGVGGAAPDGQEVATS